MKIRQSTHRLQSLHRRAQARRAFSFIELLIVMMLLGVMAGVAAPKYRKALETTHLECAAKQLAADLRRARSEAQQVSATRSIAFDLANHSYSSTDMMQLDRPTELFFASLASTGFSVLLDSADFGGSPVVTFDIYGNPQSAGVILLSLNGQPEKITLNAVGLVEIGL